MASEQDTAPTQVEEDWQLTKKTVLERSQHMFNNPLMSDIQFTCGDDTTRKQFFAHKYVLATSSPVFYAMFYGELAEERSVIHLPDTDADTFGAFLRFLYTDECASEPVAVLALGVIYLAKKYLVPSLVERCWEIVDENVGKVLDSDLFITVDVVVLELFLERETLVLPETGELRLIEAVLKWCDHQCSGQGIEATGENKRAVLGAGRSHLRFLALTQEEFAREVAMSGLITESEVIAFYQVFNGMPAPCELTCSLPRREGNSMSCIRFAQKDIMKPDKDRWRYSQGNSDQLSFTVDKPALLYGFRLFGDASGGKYEVTVREPIEMSATYTSTSNSKRTGSCCGFDVMFAKPIGISSLTRNGIALTIKGANSYHGQNGKSCVVVDGMSVTFCDFVYDQWVRKKYPTNGTTVKRGQIYELIICRRDTNTPN